MRAFITGIAGFAGSHLADLLLADGWDVAGLVAPGEPLARVEGIRDRLSLTEGDVADAGVVEDAIVAAAPTCVFHLAAVASPPVSHGDPTGTYRINVGGTLNVFEAVRTRCPDARVVAIGSGDAYGAVGPDELPITESQPWRPLNPYAATKAMTDVMGEAYAAQYGLAIVRARPFNHAGPAQSPSFVCSDFARQVARIEAGLQAPVVRVGELSSGRDFSDVRDIVRAYVQLADPSVPPAAYNICSGRATTIQAVLDRLLSLTDVEIAVEREQARVRKIEVPEVRGDGARFHEATGWSPAIDFAQTLADTLAYWRTAVAAEVAG